MKKLEEESDGFISETVLIEISEKCPDDCLSYLLECLKLRKLIIELGNIAEHQFLTIMCTFKDLCIQAEKLELVKDVYGAEKVKEFVYKDLEKYKGHAIKDTFFTPDEQLFLIETILLDVEFKKDTFIKHGLNSFGASDALITGCIYSKPQIIESFTPMHNKKDKEELWQKVKHNPIVFPIHDIKNYYGEEVAFYFAWMSFLTWALFPVAIFGVALFLHRPKGITVDDSPYLPAYALLMAFWTIIYTKCWRRKEHELALSWGTSAVEKAEVLRPEFCGILRKSPVTGKPEKYFPAWKRRIRYLMSFFLSLPFLALGVIAMTLSLNLNGYIKHKESPIYFASLSRFAQPGHIFAADNPYYGWMIPTIGHSIVINILNKLYRSIATYATDIENHRTNYQWQGSITVKRVLFELFDCYLPLFYIAFYQLDIISLRRELVGLFWGDEIRRVVTESIIPLITEKIQAFRHKKYLGDSKKKDNNGNFEVLENLLLEEYEQFDDYIEMVVQFGYVTLFASAFPLCSMITILFLFLEARSDMFKLLFLSRRPIVRRAKNIGVWSKVLTTMTILSMITNCFLFGFASEQLASWAPEMYETHADGDQYIVPGYGRYAVGVVFGCEHVLIFIVMLSHYLISDAPNHVKIELARRDYLKNEELKLLKEKSLQEIY